MALLIITDSQITDGPNFPVGIVIVGVCDGPWGQMKALDDALPTRRVDNVQFVSFALYAALTELP